MANPPVAGASVWLDASSTSSVLNGSGTAATTGQTVGSWNNIAPTKSGTLQQATDANRPIYGSHTLNGKPVLYFDGTDDGLASTNVISNQGNAMSAFVVVRRTADATNYRRSLAFIGPQGSTDWNVAGNWCIDNGANGTTNRVERGGANDLGSLPAVNTAYIAEVVFDGTMAKSYLTGQLYGQFNSSGSFDINQMGVGEGFTNGSATSFFQGDIAEVLVYNSALSDSDRQTVEAYLTQKWALPAVSPPPSTSVTVNNPSFESPDISTGTHQTGGVTGWTTSGAGLNDHGGFDGGNAADGSQDAFIQGGNAYISQSISFPQTSAYTVTFYAKNRPGYATEDFKVEMDGTLLQTINAPDNWTRYDVLAYNVSAGSHTLKFTGINSGGGDRTFLLDNVSIVISNAPPPSPAPVINGSFEGPDIASGNWQNTVSSWDVTGSAGISDHGGFYGTYTPDGVPDGQQVGFIQGGSSLSQTVNFPTAGSYAVKFYAAQRNGYPPEQIRVQIDGVTINTYEPSTTAPTFTLYKSSTFSVTAGNHVVKFEGYNPYGGDRSIILDMVSIPAIYTGGPDPVVRMPELTAKPGEAVTAPVTTDGALGLKSFILTINYDPRLLTITNSDVKAGNLLGDGWTVVPEVAGGVIHVSAFGTQAISNNDPGNLLDITYHVRKGVTGVAALHIDAALSGFFDAGDAGMVLDARDGSVTIAGKKDRLNWRTRQTANDAALISILPDVAPKSIRTELTSRVKTKAAGKIAAPALAADTWVQATKAKKVGIASRFVLRK